MIRAQRSWLVLALLSAIGACQSEPNGGAGSGAVGGAGGMQAGIGASGVSGGIGGMMTGGGVGGAIMSGGVGGMSGGSGGMIAGGTGGAAGMEPIYDGPMLLSETGLYTDIVSGAIASDAREYQPLGELWSDGATKKRWLKLPPDAVIDTSDMDNWVFPTGTQAFKEFTRDGVRIETRMVWKRAPDDWQLIAFLWNAEQTEAIASIDGQRDAFGTMHDVPDATKCPRCHAPRSEQLLGTTALMLSHDKPGLTLDTLIAEGRISHPPAAPLTLPGDADTQAALAYLHANCGGCHNPDAADADRDISVYFWQKADALATLEDTVTYRSLVIDKATPVWIDAVLPRMGNRGTRALQMPPLATEVVDPQGMALVGALMERLKQDVPPLPPPAASGTCPDIQPIVDIFKTLSFQDCSSTRCHGGDLGGLYYRDAASLLSELVAKPPQGEGCENIGLSRVEPGSPERSLFWLKLNPGPPCGTIMPPAFSLTPDQLQVVYDWISACTPGE